MSIITIKKKRYCSAYGCLNSTINTPGLSLFHLPKEPERCREWLSLIGREDLLNKEILKPNSYQVCEVHFENSEIEIIKKLKVNAVPTRNFYNESHTGSPTTSKEPKASNVCSQTKSNIDTITNVNIKKPDTISKGTQTETHVNIIDSDEKSQTARYLSQKTPRKGKLLQKLSDSELKRKRLEAPDRPDLTTEESTCSTPFKPDVISTSQLRGLLESEIKKDAIHTRPFPRQPDIAKSDKEDVPPTSPKSGAREPDIEEDNEDIVPNNKSTQTDESFITIIVPPTTIKSEIIEKNSVSVQTDSEHKPTCLCHHIKAEPVDADDTAVQVSCKTVYSVYVQTDQELHAADASGSDKAADQELNVADISGPDLPSNTQGKLTHSGLHDSDQGTVPSSSSKRKRKLENPHRSDKKKGVKLKKLF